MQNSPTNPIAQSTPVDPAPHAEMTPQEIEAILDAIDWATWEQEREIVRTDFEVDDLPY